MDFAVLRAQFPVFERFAYLNAGSAGPVPAAALEAAADAFGQAARDGRATPYFQALVERRERLRAAYAALLCASPEDVAVTTCTSEGVVRVLVGLDLRAGDEVLTGSEEHPGLLGPLAEAARRRGITMRTAALRDLPDAVGPRTRLVACSHVSWLTGEVVPERLAAAASGVPVLLDGAQAVGAVPVDVAALGCAFYAGSGQKWLCGPVGTGMLWISPAWRDGLAPLGPTLVNLVDPYAGAEAHAHPDARAHDTFAIASEAFAGALAAHDVLAGAGWQAVHVRARELAGRLAAELAERGRVVATRGQTTLVSWEEADPDACASALAGAGVIVRAIPGTPYARASVGAWNDEADVRRLLAALP